MKKLILATMLIGTFSAFAGTQVDCKSANYTVSITTDSSGNIVLANYGVNNRMNDGADVEVEKAYSSSRVLAAQLKVDGASNKFELAVTKNVKGVFEGKIFSGKYAQNAKCKSQYVVTSDDRDDDEGQNL